VAEVGRWRGIVGLHVCDGLDEQGVVNVAQLAEGRLRDDRAAVAVGGIMHARPLAVLADAMGHVECFGDDARIVAEDLGHAMGDQVGLHRMAARVGRVVRDGDHRVDAVVHQVRARAVELVLVVRGKRQTRVLEEHHEPDQAHRRAGSVLEDRQEVGDDVVGLGEDLGPAADAFFLVVLHVVEEDEFLAQRIALVGGGGMWGSQVAIIASRAPCSRFT
jgi:hypothetical protein